ncbi:DUF4898 domain-containing protein [Acidianus ambivalens]|uniref:DUF4898 domain-containing protein n=1 Tax=Acidianus ambivalens TaxID=2283 RepID=A0A650CU46_ACIAM|nr:DUF4898 domain-containing protein [Acidianus ambivalens]MQL56120.1 DUF4898 domain-containing protein [Acidianus ambivalens]QGR21336.1 DUF4898 domain-containing protein [Acidianus ambivalens]
MERKKIINEECLYYKEIPRSIISNYEKFFNFVLPKNVEDKEIIISIPEAIFHEIEIIRNSILKVIKFKTIIIVLDKSSNISVCIK